MAQVTLDISEDGAELVEVEFGNLQQDVLIRFEGTQIGLCYLQAEKLYKELKPFFEVEKDEEGDATT